jgi:phage-related tail fiber protein
LAPSAATTADTPALAGLLTVDGVALLAGDRVLVRAQVLGVNNGLYVAAAGAWARPLQPVARVLPARGSALRFRVC